MTIQYETPPRTSLLPTLNESQGQRRVWEGFEAGQDPPACHSTSIFGVSHTSVDWRSVADSGCVSTAVRACSPDSPTSPKTPKPHGESGASNIFGVSPCQKPTSSPASPTLKPSVPDEPAMKLDDIQVGSSEHENDKEESAECPADSESVTNAVCPEPDVTEGLVVDLCGNDYVAGGIWRNRVANQPDARVPSGVLFDGEEKAFHMSSGGNIIRVALPTSGVYMPEVSYVMWLKLNESTSGSLGWVMTQSPDYGWSRALTINDYRLGHVSITTSRFWDSGLGKAPSNKWFHIVGVWRQGGESTVYLDGVRGSSTVAKNGKGSDPHEEIIIGGRAPLDPAHNPSVKVYGVRVYDRALEEAEVNRLFSRGRRPGSGSAAFEQDSGGEVADLRGESAGLEADTIDCVEVGEKQPDDTTVRKQGAAETSPLWDEESGNFWFDTGVNAYELPDGCEWQVEFQQQVRSAMPGASKRTLRPQISDTPLPGAHGHGVFGASSTAAGQPGEKRRGSRGLARHPSDPEQRAIRAAHSSALQQMSRKPGEAINIAGQKVALFRFGDRVFAVGAECPHQGGRLSEGEVGDIEDMVDGKRCYVTCPVHKFRFDLATGAVIEGKCNPLPIFPVRIRGASTDRRIAMVEIGFGSLAAEFFADFDVDDF